MKLTARVAAADAVAAAAESAAAATAAIEGRVIHCRRVVHDRIRGGGVIHRHLGGLGGIRVCGFNGGARPIVHNRIHDGGIRLCNRHIRLGNRRIRLGDNRIRLGRRIVDDCRIVGDDCRIVGDNCRIVDDGRVDHSRRCGRETNLSKSSIRNRGNLGLCGGHGGILCSREGS